MSKKSRLQKLSWYCNASCSTVALISTAVRPQTPAAPGGRQNPVAVRQNRDACNRSASGGRSTVYEWGKRFATRHPWHGASDQRRQKARRGELHLTVAVGYVKSDGNRIEKDPNRRVRDAIGTCLP